MSRQRVGIRVLLSSEEFDRFEASCQQRNFKKRTLIALLIPDHLDDSAFDLQAKTLTNQETAP